MIGICKPPQAPNAHLGASIHNQQTGKATIALKLVTPSRIHPASAAMFLDCISLGQRCLGSYESVGVAGLIGEVWGSARRIGVWLGRFEGLGAE